MLVPAGELQMGSHPDYKRGYACQEWELALPTAYLDV